VSANINMIIGARIAGGRRKRGWYQRELADVIGRSESWVSQVERGTIALDSVATAEAIAAALRLDVAHVLAFDVRYATTPNRTTPQSSPARAEADWMSTLRRTFVVETGGFLAETAIAASPLAALVGYGSRTPPTPDTSFLDDLKIVGSVYRRAYRIVPSETLLPLALDQVKLVLSLQPSDQPEHVRNALLRHAGEMAALAAGVHMMDHADFEKADPLLSLAMSAAKQVGDVDLTAVVYGGRAFLSTYNSGAEEALEWALAGQDVAVKGASPRTRAWVCAVASEMHATLGHADEAFQALDVGRTALQRPPEDELWAGLGWMDEAKLDAYEGGDLLRLRRYQPAIDRLTVALDGMEPTVIRHRATALADRAHALALSGETDQACADADQSLQYVAHVHHRKTFRRIENIARLVGPLRSAASSALREHVLEVRSNLRTQTKGAPPQ